MLRELAAPGFGRVAALMEVFPWHRGHFGSVIRGANPGRVFVDDPEAPSRALVWPSDGFQYLAISSAGAPADAPADAPASACAARREEEIRSFLEDCRALLAREARGAGGACLEIVVAQAELESRIAAVFGDLRFFAVRRLAYEPPAATPAARPAPGPGARIARRVEDAELYLGLEDGSGPIGTCRGWIYRDDVELDISVLEGRRRSGWGAYLGTEFLRLCSERGLVPRWTCWEDKEESRSLARKLGFRNPGAFNVYIHDPESEG